MHRSSIVREGLLVTVLLSVQFMLVLDVAIVSVAMPDIQQDLHIGAGDLQWVATAYTLTFGGLLVAAGRLGDLLGRRRLFLAGTALFTVGSLLCGLSQQSWQLFAARGLQGVGAALVSPAVLALLNTSSTDEHRRSKVLGLWGAVASGGAVVGQLIGGVITDGLGWRWVFLVNVPIGVAACLATRPLVPADQDRTDERLDGVGAATLTIGLLCAVFAIGRVGDHGLDVLVISATAAAVVLLAWFALHERRYPQPLVRFAIFANRSLIGGNVLSVINGAMVMTAIFFSTLYMQHILGYSALQAGLAFAPVTVVILVLSWLTGRLVEAYGIRKLLIAGAIFTGAGIAALTAMRVGGSYWVTVLPGLLLLGIGQGLAFAPATVAATHGVRDEDQGLAGGLVTMSQQLGGAVGFAVLATVAAAALPAPGTSDPAALVHSFQLGYLVGLVLPVVAVVAAFRLIPGPAEMSVPAPAAESQPGVTA